MASFQRIIVGISGATGIQYAEKVLRLLHEHGIEIHLIISKPADLTRHHETDFSRQALTQFAHTVYNNRDISAPIASGSFPVDGMIIVPASVKILAEVANGIGDNLISRAADVVLKERRRLILALRETPFSLIHIENMHRLTQAGGIIMPPVPAFYHRPETLDEMISDTAYRLLDVFGYPLPKLKRWGIDY